ncbi:hypothetical protein IFM89_003587 [Coptis chinensis]|uniref:Cupin type-1 domain-containing protein n=1 Tax=Coptis chinensis TaxID=261450 RepID=A0A835LTS9_9MAGN|nr:hypothetical protein IFM89_003587 [Coptis chinensis]
MCSLGYTRQGRGLHGAVIPGCPESYQSSQQSEQSEQQQLQREQGQSQQQRSLRGDRHQKVRIVRQGDVVATPVGVAKWIYNNGDTPLVMVSLIDTSNYENQLDDRRRSFYLGGNPQQQQQRQQQEQQREQGQRRGSQQETSSNNIFSGFDNRMLAEVFGVSTETARRLRGENDNRGNIVRVENELQVIRPPRMEQEEEEQEEQRYGGNGLDESNALTAPRWHMNSHSVMYVTRGNARVQIVGNYQRPIYDGQLRQGQLLIVPQNFATMKQAGENGFEWISFQTNNQALTSPIAGKNSVIRALPQEILMNAFRISSEEARSLKYNRDEIELFAPRSESQGREIAA